MFSFNQSYLLPAPVADVAGDQVFYDQARPNQLSTQVPNYTTPHQAAAPSTSAGSNAGQPLNLLATRSDGVPTPAALTQGRVTAANEPPSQPKSKCPACGKILTLGCIKRHWLTSCLQNPNRTSHKCEGCNKEFYRKDALKRHRETPGVCLRTNPGPTDVSPPSTSGAVPSRVVQRSHRASPYAPSPASSSSSSSSRRRGRPSSGSSAISTPPTPASLPLADLPTVAELQEWSQQHPAVTTDSFGWAPQPYHDLNVHPPAQYLPESGQPHNPCFDFTQVPPFNPIIPMGVVGQYNLVPQPAPHQPPALPPMSNNVPSDIHYGGNVQQPTYGNPQALTQEPDLPEDVFNSAEAYALSRELQSLDSDFAALSERSGSASAFEPQDMWADQDFNSFY
ncbi:hypothetical protein BD779DRAFT_1678300 [Infundibulicybe gibba]|nr:hypothetical protein BD779DRAFT_1678300 [Infundibulicybe gibba]